MSNKNLLREKSKENIADDCEWVGRVIRLKWDVHYLLSGREYPQFGRLQTWEREGDAQKIDHFFANVINE